MDDDARTRPQGQQKLVGWQLHEGAEPSEPGDATDSCLKKKKGDGYHSCALVMGTRG